MLIVLIVVVVVASAVVAGVVGAFVKERRNYEAHASYWRRREELLCKDVEALKHELEVRDEQPEPSSEDLDAALDGVHQVMRSADAGFDSLDEEQLREVLRQLVRGMRVLSHVR